MRIKRRTFNSLAVAGAATGFAGAANAQAKPITIGFGMALTGGLAPNGKAALLAMQIAEEEINAKGGILGRPVKLVYYDDQSNPSSRARPLYEADGRRQGRHRGQRLRHQHDRAGDADRDAEGSHVLRAVRTRGELRVQIQRATSRSSRQAVPSPRKRSPRASSRWRWRRIPSRQTLAMIGADAEFPRNALEGVRSIAKKYNLKIVYDKNYPPATADYTPVVRAVAATNPDIFFAASYPPDIGRHHPRQPRDRLQAQDLRRRHGRPAGDSHQDAARAAPERHRGLRLLAAVGGLRHRRGPRVREEVPDQVGRGRRRPPGLLPAALRLRPDAGDRAGGDGRRQHRGRQARRVHAQGHLQDRRRRHQVQRRRASGRTRAGHGGAVPGRPGQRRGAVHAIPRPK